MNRSSKLWRLLAVTGVATLGMAAASFGATAALATPTGNAGSTGSQTASTSTCASGATCVTIPAQCPSGTTCPTVSVEPANDLGQNQWIYLSLSNFPADSIAQIYYCDDQTALTDTSPPYCVLEGTPDFTYPNQELPISAQGTAVNSFQTLDNPDTTGDTAFVGQIPGDTTAPSQKFFCGDATDQCSVDVVDWTLLPAPLPENIAIPLPADTAVVPLGFTPQSQGCQKAAFPSTFSDNSIEWLIPHEAPIACTEKNPAVPDNTATSTSLILPALQGGNVVFLDDPQAADVQAALAKVHYTVVPLVSSAVVMGYVAAMQQDGQKYPFNSVRLTPNEVAGLTTYLYQGPFNGDMVSCPGGTCSAIEDLNSVPGFVGASEYGSFIPSEATGVTEELTDWICHAPNVPFVLNGKLITDPNTAQTTFTTSNGQTPWPITKCTTFDQFPPLKPLGSLFAPAADAPHQVKFLRTFAIPPQFQPSPVIGFTPIDWDDARYNGLDSASLQNADGQFVAPSTASVQAEVSAEPISKAGYPLPTPALKVNGGYPMSTVIDALVPDSSLPAVQSKPIADMMNELLQYTTTTANLPDGFVPLPAKLAAIAHTNLAKAIAAENVPAPTATTTTPTVSPDSATEGTSVAYSATVTAASGTPAGGVTFAAGSTALCTAKLAAGKGSCTASDAPIGSDIVTASYAGGGGFAASSATTTIEVVSSGSQTTVPPTTIGGGDGTTGVATSPTTTVATSVPSTTVPTRTSTKKKTGGGGNLSVADVTLASGAARIALPVALAVGGILIALSLGLSFVGVLRRRHAAGTDGG